ncbi:HXXEE domain-containing protein [Rothia sp. P5766]|uniref:HXXEE domain-containing protein n=1 Tax=Rothia sp. P5766 TaxID=3402656 RepID=UPI003AEDD67A
MTMQPRKTALTASLLGVFAAHNCEEVAHFYQDIEALPHRIRECGPWSSQQDFALATALLTGASALALVAGACLPHGKLQQVLVLGPPSALVGNAMSHICRGLIQRRYNGGLMTAPLMAGIAGRLITKAGAGLPARTRWGIYIGSNAATLPLIFVALAAGKRVRPLLPIALSPQAYSK